MGWNGASERAVAQHVAMTYGVKDKGGVHNKWKEARGIRAVPRAMPEVNQAIEKILARYEADVVMVN